MVGLTTFTGQARREYSLWAQGVAPIVLRYVALVMQNDLASADVWKNLQAYAISLAGDMELLGEHQAYSTAGTIAVTVASMTAKLLVGL